MKHYITNPSLYSQAGPPQMLEPYYCFSNYALRPSTYTLYQCGQQKPISTLLFALLREFMQHPYQVLSRDALLAASSHISVPFETRRIDVAINRLRKTLGDNDPTNWQFIKTVRAKGYLFLPEVYHATSLSSQR